jgi:uncharacterized membrane protein YkvA (DUF1232 family)
MADEGAAPIVVNGFTSDRFWTKLRRFARVAGRAVVERALRLYYASQDPHTPEWARRAIYAALAYFILPFDIIPDIIPGIGYTDDLATLSLTLLAVSAYVSRDIKVRAHTKTVEWLGEP